MQNYSIQLRDYAGQSVHVGQFTPQGEIKRRVYAEQVGNFNPIFCRFNRKWYLVFSESGDTSDPFRREESYAESFFIAVEQPCQRKTVSRRSA